MKLLDKFLGNPLLYILIGAVAGLGLVVGGLFADVAILTTLGGILLGLTVGGVVQPQWLSTLGWVVVR